MEELPKDDCASISIYGPAFAIISAGYAGDFGEITLLFVHGSRVFLEVELSPFSVEF